MQIWDIKKLKHSETPELCPAAQNSIEIMGSSASSESLDRGNASKSFHLVVEPGLNGLRIVQMGSSSPLRWLHPLGRHAIRGQVELGDRIVAIAGVPSRNLGDLDQLSVNGSSCEISIFDHRTRLTVSWLVQFHNSIDDLAASRFVESDIDRVAQPVFI